MTIALSLVSLSLIIFCAIYVRQLSLFVKGLSRLSAGKNVRQYSIDVIVAARNEEHTIEDCVQALTQQDYPPDCYRIVIVDDQSTDRTSAIVETLARQHPKVSLEHVKMQTSGISPKINAIEQGLKVSTSELVFTTDADCTVGPRWISTMVKHFEENVGVVSGITLFENKNRVPPTLFGFQAIDFFSQTACGAGAIGLGNVNNCNGSNMGFRRSAFAEVNGYTSIAHVNSGSDSLLAQRIVSTTKWKMRFAFEPASHVKTVPLTSWNALLQQRMRWAGQTTYYNASTLMFLIASFGLYFLLLVSLPISLMSLTTFPAPVCILILKCLTDYWIIARFMRLSEVEGLTKYFLVSEVIHLPVIVAAVIGSFFGSFEWSGRRMQRQTSRQS